jgi:hypothetical protein
MFWTMCPIKSRTKCPTDLCPFSATFDGCDPGDRRFSEQQIFDVAPDYRGELLKQVVRHRGAILILAVAVGGDPQRGRHLIGCPAPLVPQAMHPRAELLVKL